MSYDYKLSNKIYIAQTSPLKMITLIQLSSRRSCLGIEPVDLLHQESKGDRFTP